MATQGCDRSAIAGAGMRRGVSRAIDRADIDSARNETANDVCESSNCQCGAYEAFLSMFIQRPTVLVWLLAPLVWPVSWLLNGPTGKFRLAYLLLCVLVIATNAALYAFLSWAVLGLLLRRTSQRNI